MTRLGEYLLRNGLNDSALAGQVGVSRPTITKIRQGNRRPSASVARRIEAATSGEVTAASLLGVSDVAAVATAKPLNDGRWFAPVGSGMSVELPADLLRAFGFEDGDTVIFRQTKDGVLMSSQRKAIRRIQDDLAKLVRPGESVVDELIAERHAEAARE